VNDPQTLTVLLLPTSAGQAASRGMRAIERLGTTYEGSTVLFFAELTPTMWARLKPADGLHR
jgi:hypothetical protein